jgi:hypothetical protein
MHGRSRCRNPRIAAGQAPSRRRQHVRGNDVRTKAARQVLAGVPDQERYEADHDQEFRPGAFAQRGEADRRQNENQERDRADEKQMFRPVDDGPLARAEARRRICFGHPRDQRAHEWNVGRSTVLEIREAGIVGRQDRKLVPPAHAEVAAVALRIDAARSKRKPHAHDVPVGKARKPRRSCRYAALHFE